MLKLTTGVGSRESEVKDDMVMARGVGRRVAVVFEEEELPDSPPAGSVEVHTTTECDTSRMRERNCSGSGVADSTAEECGCTRGA
jgi:hypothetical protein